MSSNPGSWKMEFPGEGLDQSIPDLAHRGPRWHPLRVTNLPLSFCLSVFHSYYFHVRSHKFFLKEWIVQQCSLLGLLTLWFNLWRDNGVMNSPPSATLLLESGIRGGRTRRSSVARQDPSTSHIAFLRPPLRFCRLWGNPSGLNPHADLKFL